jgi:5-methylcytosine-specific restriction endonuclease McrA
MDILDRPVLQLNKDWIAICTVTVRTAVKMCFGEWRDAKGDLQPKARILQLPGWIAHTWEEWEEVPIEPDDLVIHSGTKSYKCPEIVIVAKYNKIPRNQLNCNKRNLMRRDEDRCQYCGCRVTTANMTIDHVIPRSKGGVTSWENCVVSCFACNQKKKDRSLKDARMELLREPAKPGMEIIGQTKHKIKSWDIFFNRNSEGIVWE